MRTDSLPDRIRAYDIPVDTSAMDASTYGNPAVSPGAAAGGSLLAALIITAVDASIDAARNSSLNEVLGSGGFDAEARFNAVLHDRLAAHGYQLVTDDSERSGQRPVTGSAALEAGADAVLDADVSIIGFERLQRGWVPVGRARILLIGADGDVLMQERVELAGAHMLVVSDDAVVAPYDTRYRFVSDDAMLEDETDMTVAGMDFAVTQLAQTIGDLLAARRDCASGTLCDRESE